MTTSSALRKSRDAAGGPRFAAVLLVAVSVSIAVLPVLPSLAQAPPAPTFFWPYGKVQVVGANLSPAVQPVIAFVNGKACGNDTTLIAAAAEGTPPGDVGKTVYTIDVLASGPAAGERPGCGNPGDPVTLYFPRTGVAVQQPAFHQGGQRVDLDIVQQMGFRLRTPLMAADGSY